jgi:ferric-dicitrate binding protein FerR (iron transport regulator)
MRPVRLCAIVTYLSLALCAVASLSASDSSAVLKSTGVVVLNGAGAPATTAIFSGDTVRTTGGSVLTISAPGSTVLLPQNSQLTFKGNSVNLTGGKATVTTTKGMSVSADQYLISPGPEGSAQFEIEKSGDGLLVHAAKGAVTIKSSGKMVTLSEGQIAAVNAQSGLLSVQPAGSSTAASSSSALDSLHDSLSSNVGATVPVCPNISLCKVPPSISGQKPCRCKQF